MKAAFAGGEEILVNAAEQIHGAVGFLTSAGGGEADGGDDVDEFAEALFVEAGADRGARFW